MRYFRSLTLHVLLAVTTLCLFALPWIETASAQNGQSRTTGGLAAYLGVVPAEIVKGHPLGHPEQTMHGGTPGGRHEYHVVVALFEAATGARVSDATVTARISGLGLSGETKALDRMEIAYTTSYGGVFNLPGRDQYKVTLTIQRPGASQPVVMDLAYDHRQ
jgi:hypothetical protein